MSIFYRYHCFGIVLIILALLGPVYAADMQARFEEPKDPQWVDAEKLVVAVMGDPQLFMNPETKAHVATAMMDLAKTDHDFLAVVGDLVQNQAVLYKDYDALLLQQTTRPVYSLAGNGDLGAGLAAYQECTGLPLYYRLYRRGIRFIFLSTLSMSGKYNHICGLEAEQLAWLQKELAADTQTTTVIFSHPPVFETTWESEERDHIKMPGSMYLKESKEMRALFTQYPNIKIFAHGHLHHPYDWVDEHGRGTYHQEGEVLHISVSATANGRGSVYLYIDDEGIHVRVRDHNKGLWREDYEKRYPVKTTFKR